MFVFFFNDTATTEIYTLSLHDALPICPLPEGEGGSSAIQFIHISVDRPQRKGASMKTRFVALGLLAILFFSIALFAQVKTPQDYLGFRVGDDYKLADWQQITGYFNELGKSSDRIHVDIIGQTTLKKPFLRVTITSPANYAKLARYEEIRSE